MTKYYKIISTSYGSITRIIKTENGIDYTVGKSVPNDGDGVNFWLEKNSETAKEDLEISNQEEWNSMNAECQRFFDEIK